MGHLWMSSPDIHIRLSSGLLNKIDQAAKVNFQSRSDFIRDSIVLRLNDQRIVQNQGEDAKLEAIINQTLSLPDD
jgi:metal-responsive CopG/Arc/MetJ family transcriptional regulator